MKAQQEGEEAQTQEENDEQQDVQEVQMQETDGEKEE